MKPGAKEQILTARRKEFLEEHLPELFRNMKLLGLDLKDIEKAWEDQGLE